MKTRRIGILIYDGVQALDVVGISDVFSTANSLIARKPAPYEIVAVGVRGGMVTSESGIRLATDVTVRDGAHYDTVVVPGGAALRSHNPTCNAIVAFLKAQNKTARRVATVCTGLYALAQTGLVDGRTVTTHWRFADDVRRRWPKLNVNADAIFHNDGKYYTSAGVTAGIDLALSFVEEDFGADTALAVAREIVVYLKRSGGQLQFSQPLVAQTQSKDAFGNLAEWIRGNLQSELTLERLAERVSLSPRHFARKFKATFGLTPADFVAELRLDEARWLLVNGADRIAELADTVGYTNDDTFRRAFERRFGVAPAEYRRRFSVAPAARQAL